MSKLKTMSRTVLVGVFETFLNVFLGVINTN